jgi:hypothetical protein
LPREMIQKKLEPVKNFGTESRCEKGNQR